MHKGITPIIAIILLLLATISIAGFALIFFQRTAGTASEQAGTELEHQAGMMGENFVVEGADRNSVYIRNLGTRELKNLNFYINGAKVESTGTVPAGQVSTIMLNDSQLAQLPNDAKLKVTSLGAAREENVQFYKDEVIGYWKFDEADRDTVKDYSGNGNNGTFYGETWNDGTLSPSCPNCPQTVAGKYGNALSFDGADDYVSVADSASLDVTAITIEAWVYRGGTGNYQIADKDDANGGYQIEEFYNGRDSFSVRNSAGTQDNCLVDAGDATAVSTWNHVAATFSSGTAKIYTNGILRKTCALVPTSIGNSAANLRIGKRLADTFPFNGTIDEVRIYNRVLTQQEIVEDMNSAYPINRTVASWSFEKIENNKALDTHNIVKGKYGAAMSFDGVDDYVNVPAAASLDVESAGAVEAWVKPNAQYGGIVERLLGPGYSNDQRLILTLGDAYHSAPQIQGWIANGTNAESVSSGVTPTLGVWYHVAFTFNGSQLKIYVNGELKGTAAQTIIPEMTGAPLKFGFWNYDGKYLNSTIDEVRILNVARPM